MPTQTYTVNVAGDEKTVDAAKAAGFHSYHANGVAAIEVKASSVDDAKEKAGRFGRVLFAFL